MSYIKILNLLQPKNLHQRLNASKVQYKHFVHVDEFIWVVYGMNPNDLV